MQDIKIEDTKDQSSDALNNTQNGGQDHISRDKAYLGEDQLTIIIPAGAMSNYNIKKHTDNDFIEGIISSLPISPDLIQHLDLSNNPYVTNKLMLVIAEKFPNLESINMIGCDKKVKEIFQDIRLKTALIYTQETELILINCTDQIFDKIFTDEMCKELYHVEVLKLLNCDIGESIKQLTLKLHNLSLFIIEAILNNENERVYDENNAENLSPILINLPEEFYKIGLIDKGISFKDVLIESAHNDHTKRIGFEIYKPQFLIQGEVLSISGKKSKSKYTIVPSDQFIKTQLECNKDKLSSIKQLRLSNCEISTEIAEELKTLLPNVQYIEIDSAVTINDNLWKMFPQLKSIFFTERIIVSNIENKHVLALRIKLNANIQELISIFIEHKEQFSQVTSLYCRNCTIKSELLSALKTAFEKNLQRIYLNNQTNITKESVAKMFPNAKIVFNRFMYIQNKKLVIHDNHDQQARLYAVLQIMLMEFLLVNKLFLHNCKVESALLNTLKKNLPALALISITGESIVPENIVQQFSDCLITFEGVIRVKNTVISFTQDVSEKEIKSIIETYKKYLSQIKTIDIQMLPEDLINKQFIGYLMEQFPKLIEVVIGAKSAVKQSQNKKITASSVLNKYNWNKNSHTSSSDSDTSDEEEHLEWDYEKSDWAQNQGKRTSDSDTSDENYRSKDSTPLSCDNIHNESGSDAIHIDTSDDEHSCRKNPLPLDTLFHLCNESSDGEEKGDMSTNSDDELCSFSKASDISTKRLQEVSKNNLTSLNSAVAAPIDNARQTTV